MIEQVFEHWEMSRSAAVRALQERLAPVTLAREHTRPVPEPLLPLFPFGGLPHGQVIGLQGAGSWSIALALAGSALGEDGWMATVGVEDLGLLAAAEYGVRLDRLLLVESTPPDQLATVVAALVETIDMVALAPHREMRHTQARRLAAKCRERGANLLLLDGGRRWPMAPDLTITASPKHWEGVGQGHGHLQWRRVSVGITGRRSAARSRQVSVLAPGPGGGLAPVEAAPKPKGILPEELEVGGPSIGSSASVA